MVLLDYDDMTLGDFDNTGENEQVAYFINYCLNQDKDGKENQKNLLRNLKNCVVRSGLIHISRKKKDLF